MPTLRTALVQRTLRGRLATRIRHGVASGLVVAALLTDPGAPRAGAPAAWAQTSSPSAAQTWDVQVGGGDDDVGVEINAFFPDPLTIHAGDTVRFTFAGFHTVTFNSNKPPKPLYIPGPNPGDLEIGPAGFPYQAPDKATYNGIDQISSGTPMGPGPGGAPPTFLVTFATTGVFAYVCEIHPGMRGTIRVARAGEMLEETNAQATARGKLTEGALKAKLQADAAAYRPVATGPVRTVAAGLGDGFEASLLAFLPGNLTMKRGDWVVWTNPDPAEVHTVTFATGVQPPPLGEPQPRPNGPPRIILPASLVQPNGTTFTGQPGLLHSGLMFAGESYASLVDAPPGTYTYFCLIHGSAEGGMHGTLTVTG
jgi:plastocyanin